MVGDLSILYMSNIAISWGLFVLIWMVQIIIYPGFHRIRPDDFINYHRWYVTRISIIVLPLMICEVILAVVWLTTNAFSFTSSLSALLILVVWLSTFGLQVPIHNRLQSGKDETLIRRLVDTNWIRTIAWTMKAGVVTFAAI